MLAMMSRQEKVLYHQIHPVKLLTDWGTGALALYLLWQRRLAAALIVMFVPAIVVSMALLKWANLEPIAASRLGRYLRDYMTGTMQQGE